ncbi:nucleoside hydrolase [bacterium]|nr:nucleoside hydrolase [bacterium]
MKRVIFDCDNTMGMPFKEVDDGLTLLYLLGSPDIELAAVTTTFGNGKVEDSITQTRKLLAQVGREDIPVIAGASERHAPPTAAAKYLAEAAADSPGEISILATGPLGNLRGAAELDTCFWGNLRQIACMGGYLAPLRIGKRNVAELNLSADPEAADLVLNAVCPVILMNAQTCLQAAFTRSEIDRLTFWLWKVRLIMRTWLFAFGAACGVHEFYLWDLLPAVYLTHPEIFSDEIVQISSTVKDLEIGTLRYQVSEGGEGVTMPSQILDVPRFMEILFEAWERVSFL